MEKVVTIVVTGVIFLFFAVLLALPAGFIVMLALGILHDEWSQVPAFGYWACVVLVTVWRLMWPNFGSSKNEAG